MALSIGCRNKPWTQCFNQNLISSTGWTTSDPAVVVQAALESSAACTTMAGPEVVQPVDEIKFWLKHFVQGLFLKPMLSATIFLSIFEFRIWIPTVVIPRYLFCFKIVHWNLYLPISLRRDWLVASISGCQKSGQRVREKTFIDSLTRIESLKSNLNSDGKGLLTGEPRWWPFS